MVTCAVYDCKSNSNPGKNSKVSCQVRFFSFPATNSKTEEKFHNLVLERRALWISRIARKDLTFYDHTKIFYSRVCSRHFITGAPSHLQDTSNPDWAPSINLGHSYFQNETYESFERYLMNSQPATGNISSSDDSEDDFSEIHHETEHQFSTPQKESILEHLLKTNQTESVTEMQLSATQSESVSEVNETSLKNGEDKHDRLKYFIFSGSNKSENLISKGKVKRIHKVTHEEAFKAAETLLCYMEDQINVNPKDLIPIQSYKRKILKNMMEE